jgi:glycosyltransferase involved in cell wall biosynthesis
VSVVLVTHNHARFIDRAIASIEFQEVPFRWEILVADDSSDDGTTERLERWRDESALDIRILEAAPRLGITLNYARAFAAARGDYVAVLEGDDEWLSIDKLRLLVAHLDSHPGQSMVANRILLYDESTGSASVIPEIGFARLTTELTARRLAEDNVFATFSACMYRRDALERISPEVFEEISYDWMVNIAVLAYGNAGFHPQVMTLYRQHAGGEWSRTSQHSRDLRIRDMLPRYIELAPEEARSELTKTLHDLERRLKHSSIASVEPPAGTATVSDVRSPIPRVLTPAPLVSVVMTCYNHAPWVEEAVASVLDQTMGDLELIFVDDGSSDNSVALAAQFDDPRMRHYRLEHNQGAAAALNLAIQQTRGEFVAVINSDDAWERSKLERQLQVFNERPEVGAVFTSARFVGESGKPLDPESIPLWHSVFRQPDRSQGRWLRFFLENGNALCHPSILVRRHFYEDRGLYDNRMRQIPDLERWIDLVKYSPIAVLGDENLVKFRLLRSVQNASSHAPPNVIRGFHEHLEINRNFFRGVSEAMLREGFGDLLTDPLFSGQEQMRCEIAFLWWNTTGPMQSLNRVEAVRELRELLADEQGALLLRSRYNFTDLSLHLLAGDESLDVRAIEAGYSSNALASGQLIRIVLDRMKRLPLRRWPARTLVHLRWITRG